MIYQAKPQSSSDPTVQIYQLTNESSAERNQQPSLQQNLNTTADFQIEPTLSTNDLWSSLGLDLEPVFDLPGSEHTEPLAAPQTDLIPNMDEESYDHVEELFPGLKSGLMTPLSASKSTIPAPSDQGMGEIIAKLVEMENETDKVKVPGSTPPSESFMIRKYFDTMSEDTSPMLSPEANSVEMTDLPAKENQPDMDTEQDHVRTSRSGRPLKRKNLSILSDDSTTDQEQQPLSDSSKKPRRVSGREHSQDEDWAAGTGARPKRITKKRPSKFDEAEAEKIMRPKAHVPSKGKRRLYEFMRPFADPKMEKKRLDAINAKANRDRAKKERETLNGQMQLLRNELSLVQASETVWKERALEAESRVELLEARLRENGLAMPLPGTGYRKE